MILLGNNSRKTLQLALYFGINWLFRHYDGGKNSLNNISSTAIYLTMTSINHKVVITDTPSQRCSQSMLKTFSYYSVVYFSPVNRLRLEESKS